MSTNGSASLSSNGSHPVAGDTQDVSQPEITDNSRNNDPPLDGDPTENQDSGSWADSDDEYISSGEEDATYMESENGQRSHLSYGSTLSEHTAYFEKSLSDALDSVKLDDSLVLQAQLSGQLNNRNKDLQEKKAELASRLANLQQLYKHHITENRVEQLEKDLKLIQRRVSALLHGESKPSFFAKNKKLGVADKYPIEYNQAKNKVLEREPL